MAVRRVQLRRGTTAENTAFTGAVGEITIDTDNKSIRVHDNDQAGGFDLMRADMSNNSAIATDINFTNANRKIGEAMDGKTLTLGQASTAISIPGTLTVANYVTENDLLIQDKVIVIADGTEGAANSTDSIGLIFTRTLAGGGGAQNPALFYWDEATDRFRIETNNVTEANANWTGGATGADLTLSNLYATTGVDVGDGNITNVGQIELDTITFADAGTVITINLQDALNDKAFTLKDGGNSEYLTINTNAESTTLGVVAKTTTIQSNTIALGTDAANNVAITVASRTGDNDGQDLTISAGSGADSDDNLGGDLILASGSGVEVGGTSSIQFQTKVDGTSGVSEAMRIHTTGYVGIGENAPDSGLHIKGNDTKAIITLENSTGGNAQDDDPTTISFKGSGEALALAQIVGAHDGALDDDKGVLIFKPNNDTDPTEALRLDSALKATFAGAVEIATTLDMTDGNINNVATLFLDDIQCADNVNVFTISAKDDTVDALIVKDTGGLEYINVDARNASPILTLAQATNLSSTLTVTSTANLDGGIAVDTDNFTVNGATGAIDTKSTLQVDGNTTLGANGLAGSPNLTIVEHTGGATKFQVVGASGNTTVGGTLGVTGISTLSNTLKIVQGVSDGIIFNSDRGAENDQDAAIIKVLDDSDDNAHGVLTWDDGEGSFSFSGSKLNSVLDFSVGTLATPSTTISATTGAIATAGTAPVLTLKNTTGGNANGDSPTQVIFQDDAGQSLAQIQGSHDGAVDDTKGDLIFSTNSGGGLSEALRLDSANLATFAGSATVSGGTITVGGNGATIVATNATTLTLTEDTVATSAALTVGTNITVGGHILGDANEAKEIFTASALEASTITLGGGGTVVIGGAGKLRLGTTNIIENSAGETTITLNADQRTTLSGDLAVVGGATDGLAATTILLGADAVRDSAIKVVARTGANDGQDLTIEAGSTATNVGDQNGGDLILSSGGGDGNGTSDIIIKTKISGTDTTTEKVRILGSGNVGLGESSPDSLLHLSNATTPTITLQNLTGGNGAGGRATTLTFKGEKADTTEGELGNITISHDGDADDLKGKMVFSTYATTDWGDNAVNAVQAVLTLDSTQRASFAGNVVVAGNLQVDGDTTTLNTATLDVEDTVIRLNKGVAAGANTNDIGIFFERGTTGDDGIFFYGEDEGFFVLGTTTQDDHTVADFFATTTPGGLMLGSLELQDNEAASLDIKQGVNSYLKFVTTNAGEKVVFGKIFEAPTGSKIGNLTLASGSITDSDGAISFGNNTLTTTGLASLDGGINVLDKFTVSTAGATVVLNTLTLNEATGNLSDLDVQSNGTSVFKVDVSAKDAIVGATSTLFTNKIQATSDANDSFQMYLKDNTALGLVVSNVSDDVDFITVKTTTNSELITLVQATSISETLEVVGNATFDAGVHIETANANGIFFNQDGAGNASADATLITLEGGNDKDDVVLAWDTSDDAINLNAKSSIHLQGVVGGDALTIGGALKANATSSIKTDGSAVFTSVNAGNTITNAGAVSGVTSIAGTSMEITLANDDADALEIMGDVGAGDVGDHAYLSFVTTNEAEEVVVNQEGEDIDFRVEGDGNANLIFARASDDKVGIKTADPQFDLDITGTLGVSGLADLNGGIDVNVSKFTVSTAGVVTSVGGISSTTVASSFASGTTLGNVTYSTNEIAGADGAGLTIKSKQDIIFNIDSDNNDGSGKKFSFSHNANAEIASINDSGDLTLTGDVKIATTKSITLNSGAAGADADIIVDRTDGDNGVIRWVEATDRFEVDNATGTFYHLLHENDTLLTLTTDTGGGSAHSTTQASPGVSILGAANEIDVTNANGTITVGIKTNPTLTGEVTITGNIVGNGNNVLFKDRLLYIGNGNDHATRDLGFFGQYGDDEEANPEHYTGLVYQPIGGDGGKGGVYKLFHGIAKTAQDLSTGLANDITVADSELATVDVSQIRGGSALGADNTAGTTLTISGGASTGNATGGAIVFKTGGSGAGASAENAGTTALTLSNAQLATFAGDVTISGNDLDFAEGNANIGATVGANNLTLGGATSTVVSAGDLKVEGNLVYDSSTLTLTAGGEITVTKPYHKIELNDTNNATENLISISATGVVAGTVLVLQANHTARSVVVKNTSFKLEGNTDFTLDNTEDTISLIYNGTTWCELTRSSNNA